MKCTHRWSEWIDTSGRKYKGCYKCGASMPQTVSKPVPDITITGTIDKPIEDKEGI
jgi:hypothetical protein